MSFGFQILANRSRALYHTEGKVGQYDYVKVSRDVEAVQIPMGAKQWVAKDTEVRITQALGGTFTVVTKTGYMLQIAGKDADALGKKPAHAPDKDAQGKPLSVEDQVWHQLKTCYDPEIPVNIVDLGLVYECQVSDVEGGKRVDVRMTLTAPGCGMGGVIAGDAKTKIEMIPDVLEAHVEVVWDPPWDQSKMSEAAKLKLGMF
jgi:probable FeS assembly SUF system protein SufT